MHYIFFKQNKYIPGVQVWNTDFFLWKHVKFTTDKKCFIRSMLHSLLFIFPSFGQFVNTTPVQSANHLSSHFFTSSYEPMHCSARCKQVKIRKSQVWWVSRMGYNIPAESFRRVTNRFCLLWWWSSVEEKYSFGIVASYQAGNGSNRTIVVGNV